ncbi:hypothetical protein DIJ64_03080 [Mycobacterium leprae]|uniref:Uncharacterized protein n=1 Tax=Mycobacterium leprae TaxID=1769 RepID=A0AAD0KVD3_MYCLR|nr:hypothetical protein [Mycobacterium leprae]AWV47441.1 hypothetical protein DIJ64_03080 [Mycobacterium leprae]OAR20187.1 hypothetical protein A8144_02685 [Mycobacterium leprae 3125609]
MDVVTYTGVMLARHHRTPDSAGTVVCAAYHVVAPKKVMLTNCPTGLDVDANTDTEPPRRSWPRPTGSDRTTRRCPAEQVVTDVALHRNHPDQ